MSRKRYLIIGDGAAGTAAAQRLRELDGQAYITILSDDPQPAYFRAALTNYLLGELREEQIFAVPPSFYAEHHVHRVLTRVLAVDAARAQVWLSQGGQPLAYDALLVASGARANAPSFEGAALPGVMTMRTLQDARVVVDLCRVGLSQAVVLGGGPLALEWAHGMATRSAKVTMVVRETRFLPGVLDAVASDLLLARLRQRGVDVRMGETIAAAVPGPSGRVGAVRLTSGVMVPAQLVAAAIGVACNTEFLQNSGVTLSPQRAVVTDDRLRAGAPGLFAAGDVAAPGGKVLQLWEPARVQGRVAARNMVGGGEEAYTPGAHYMATRLYDLDCAAVGESAGGAAGTEDVVDFPQRTGRISYRKLVFRGGRLVGALLFGEREERVRQRGRAFKTLIDQGADVRAIQKELLDPTFDLAGYLRQNRLIEKPPVSLAGANVAAGAKVKGTQFVAIMPDSRGAPPPPKKAATMAVAATGGPPDLAGVILLAGATQFPLRGPSAVIGRDPSAAQVVLADGMVSATHAQVARHDGGVYVRDLGSSNGTWVNGAPVTVPLRLSGGDRVRVGGVELLVSIDGQSTRADVHAPTGGPADTRPHLEVRSGNALGLAFALTAPVVRIGRDPSCAVRLDDPSVSPVHAELREQGGAFHLADAQSVYGTSCGGQRLMPGHWATLKEGDAITIGQVALVFTARPTRLRAWEEMSMVSPGAGGGLMDARNTVAQSATRDVMACIGCNDCLIACPLPQASLVTIAELNHAVEQTVVTNPAVVDFVTACTQCRQCVPACPADLSRADMVLFNKMKVEDTVPNYTLLLQVGQQVSPSPWALDDLTARMAHVALFAGVPATDVRALLQKVTLRQLAAGELLVREGEFFDRMCVILSGGLEQWAEGHGGVRVHVLDLGPGSFFGELAVIADQPEPYAVVARELSVVLEIPKTALQRLMDTSPSFKTTMDELYRRRALFTYARRPDVLGGFPEQAVEEIFSRAQLRMLRAGEVVLKEDAPPGDVYLVRTGFLKVSRRVDAEREAVLVYFREGDLFGLLPLLHGERGHAYTVLATTRAEVVVIPGSHFFAVMSRYPNARAALEAGQGLEVERVARSALFSPPSPALGPKDATRAVMSMDVLVEKGLATGSEVLVVDTNVCVNCQNCVDACARRHKYGRLQLRGLQVDHFLFPTACRHCEDPVCLLCSVNGIVRLPSGEITIVEDNCIGCGACAERCPYGNINMHPVEPPKLTFTVKLMDFLRGGRERERALESLNPNVPRKAVKCDLCAGYDDYACVSACPVGAAFRIDPRSILPADAAQLGLAMKKEGR